MIKSAIFDLDGTILDSSEIWDNLGADYIRLLGKNPSENLSREIGNMSLPECAFFLRREYGIPYSAEEVIRQLTRMCEKFYTEQAALKEGAPRLLSELRSRCIRMSIATAGDVHLSMKALSQLGVAEFFSGAVSCTDYGAKTSPEVFFAAADLIRAVPEETVVFENALHAVRTAKNAGFVTAAVMDCGEPNQPELQKIADFYAPSLSVFADIVNDILSFRR